MLYQVALAGAGHRVLVAENGKHGLHLLEHQEVDLMLVDILMAEMDGLELIPQLRRIQPACKIIAKSGVSGVRGPLCTASIWERTTRSRSRSVLKSCWMWFHRN
jgi:DNA-binding NtrC family response regulator